MKLSKIISKIIGVVLNALIVLVSVLIIIGIYYATQVTILKKDYANLFGYTIFEVATGSMADTINIGDVVVVKITKDVQENDIIVFQEENDFITHRLITKNDEQIITKGDANNSQDKPITEEQILGEVIKIIPNVGTWKIVIQSPEIIALIIIVIILLGYWIYI
jgi:signal peptidase I